MIAPKAAPPRELAIPSPELVEADLLHDLAELAALMQTELAGRRWLDAFLLAAGMNQVAEDHLHRDPASLAKVAASVGGIGGRAIESVRHALIAVRAAGPRERAVISWQQDLADLVLEVAAQVAGGRPPEADGRALVQRVAGLPQALRTGIVRLPSCFRSLDLMPDDVAQLAQAFAARWPDRAAPLLVVGVRTSGSYLAPLLAAHLSSCGFHTVGQMTARPGHGWLEHERRALDRAVRWGATALLVDDPPSSGSAVARTAAQLEAAGFARSRIVLCLPLTGPALPDTLSDFESVVLERSSWAIEAHLRPEFIAGALQEMTGVAAVESVTRLPLPVVDDPWEESVDRRHVRALYALEVRLADGRRSTRHAYAKGVGLGYFGRHSLALAASLRDYVPELYAVSGGLLLRAWQPEAWRATANFGVDGIPERVAAYVHARARATRVARDLSARLVGRQAVWQRTADLLLQPFGRLRLPLRSTVHRLARRLLQVSTPSVVDGSMGLQHWFADPRGRFAVKVDNDERAFSNEDIYSYDAAYDLGAAASSLRAQAGSSAAGATRSAYERLAGEPVDDERWFLYQLLTAELGRRTLRVHADGAAGDAMPRLIGRLDGTEDALESIQREYMRACYLSDVVVQRDGPLCAIDVDGTLETASLGFTSIGPHGALALRALTRHGYRAVLASGRSLDEVRARCTTYSLPAGVAEYGAVVYDAITGESVELLTDGDRSSLERVRAAVRSLDGLHLDARYGRSVRAFIVDRKGRRRGLAEDAAAAIVAAAGAQEAVVAVPGWSQTDFISAHVDKATGLQAAARLMGSRAEALELAVGDAMADLPMLRLAKRPCVPAGADPGLRGTGARFMPRSGQAGLADAVAQLIGHRPGSCGVCRTPRLNSDAGLLMRLMASYEERGWRRLRGAFSLAWSLREA